MEDTVRWVAWLMLTMSLAILLVILFPQIALWLPEVLGFRV
jgi:TRAP-type C4-dicarboxylate transport system permease large subunit